MKNYSTYKCKTRSTCMQDNFPKFRGGGSLRSVRHRPNLDVTYFFTGCKLGHLSSFPNYFITMVVIIRSFIHSYELLPNLHVDSSVKSILILVANFNFSFIIYSHFFLKYLSLIFFFYDLIVILCCGAKKKVQIRGSEE